MSNQTQNKLHFILRVADNVLILGQRISEWCGHGPVLEEDIALSNISLDYFGQANHLLEFAATVEGNHRDADAFAFMRDESDFRNILLVELPNGDYAFTIARQFFFSAWYKVFLEQLVHSSDEFLKGFAEKSIKEVKYHLQHASDWMIRMGDGTEESHKRISNAINDIKDFLPELFSQDEIDMWAKDSSLGPLPSELQTAWLEIVNEVMENAGLEFSLPDWGQKGGRKGMHTEHLGFLLAEMQYLQRALPGAKW
jgi:ring-1,2-phenylacetyl-CoA epoxidase subunit PaaC